MASLKSNGKLTFYKVWKDRMYGNTLYPNMQCIWFLHKDKDSDTYTWYDITNDEQYNIPFDTIFDAEEYLRKLVDMKDINKWCKQ